MLRQFTAIFLAVGLVGAAGAEAAIKAGVYKGKTRQDAKVSLRVLANKKSVVKYSLEGAVLACSDNENRQLQGFTTASSDRIPLSSTGKFGFTIANDDESVAAQVKGTIKAPRATGTVRFVASFNDQNQLDPNGSVRCDSGSVPWSAKKR
jgi:hypothetical protein